MSRAVMQQALDALRYARKAGDMNGLELKPVDAAAEALRAALAQQDEPVAQDEFRNRLNAVLGVVRRYLPPDGISVKSAMSEIIALVDPWPEQTATDAQKPADPSEDQILAGNVESLLTHLMRDGMSAKKSVLCQRVLEQARSVLAMRPVAQPLRPFTPAQRRRIYDNSPEHHADVTSLAGFERIVSLTERAHKIGGAK